MTEAVDGITVRTAILALNPAVESVQTGAAGAGFSVIAGQVGALALHSANATAETA